MTKRLTEKVLYNFSKHVIKLDKLPVTKTLKDLHFDLPNAPCQFGVSEPFKLFDSSTVQIIRDELQYNEFIENNCYFTSPQAPLVIRGAYKYSSFLYDLWNCPKLADYMSSIIGTNVIPHTLNDELGHINVQFPNNSKDLIFNWHVDQDSPLVLIVMLSNIPEIGAVGGATLYKDGYGNTHELVFKDIGYAYLLHGTQIPHAAEPGNNFKRLTGVCGYKIDDKKFNGMDYDPTCLGNAISFSSHPQLANNYFSYRLDDLITKSNSFKHRFAWNGEFNGDYFDYFNAYKSLEHLRQHTELTLDSFRRFLKVKDNQRPLPIKPPKGIYD